MPDNRSKQNFESWSGGRCHPNAPAGGGGPGNFTQAGPLHFGGSNLPHPSSPAGRYLTPEKIRAPGFMERAQSLVEAYTGALRLAPAAIYQETGYQLGQILDSLLPGLLQMLAILGISVVVGAGAGATIGFFLGGVGAAPGAVVGGELGLEVGTAVLTWMGLGFLALAIGESLGELTSLLTHAISRAWHAAEQNHPKFEIETAAHELAQTAGILFRLILQGILAYVLKKGAVSSSKAAVSTGQTIIKGGTQAAADETLAEVSALLKKSKLPDGFIVWIEKNWEDLRRNPKLMNEKTGTNIPQQQPSSSAVTPAELKAMRERPNGSAGTEKASSESKPVAERTSNEKGAFGERTAHDRMTEKGYEPVGNTDGNYQPGKQGIDGVYRNPNPPPDYIITEVKYGSADLGMTKDGKQMSSKWIDNRLIDKVGEENADAIWQSAKKGNVEKWLIQVDENGSTSMVKLDNSANKLGKLTSF